MRRASVALFATLTLASFVARASPPRAEPERIEHLVIDSERSRADFEVKVLWLIGVHGRLGSVHGTVLIDHFRDTATVEARIDANVVSMRSRNHEEWVKSSEFFDTAHYPQIVFVSDAIPLRRLQTGGEIDGLLTLRGIEKQVRFELLQPDCPAASGDDCPVEAQGDIRRSEFGMSSHRGTLADKVELSFSIATKPMPGSVPP